jgi:hypothetical protein
MIVIWEYAGKISHRYTWTDVTYVRASYAIGPHHWTPWCPTVALMVGL